MKRISVALLIVLFAAPYAMADLYKWTDKDGKVHITDSMEVVPQKQRPQMEVYPSTPPTLPVPAAPPATNIELIQGSGLYGEKPLAWWKYNIAKKREEIKSLKADMESKNQYISIYKRGRRFGQTFKTEEIERYKTLKKEVSKDKKSVEQLEKKLSEFLRKARLAGVPRKARGE